MKTQTTKLQRFEAQPVENLPLDFIYLVQWTPDPKAKPGRALAGKFQDRLKAWDVTVGQDPVTGEPQVKRYAVIKSTGMYQAQQLLYTVFPGVTLATSVWTRVSEDFIFPDEITGKYHAITPEGKNV